MGRFNDGKAYHSEKKPTGRPQFIRRSLVAAYGLQTTRRDL
jgi:hypothetical protein